MIQHPVSFKATWVLRFILLISIAITSACDNDEVVRPQTPETESTEAPLPVREWYPAPKPQRHPPMTYAPVQTPAMTSSVDQGSSIQQHPWGGAAQQPVYDALQFSYQPQPQVNQYQQPPVTATQQPVVTWPQPVAPQYSYPYMPRPWGNTMQPGSNQNPARSTDSWPQGGYTVPWGVPGGSPAGQPAQVPGSVYYDTTW
jgi:hypothetical protein